MGLWLDWWRDRWQFDLCSKFHCCGQREFHFVERSECRCSRHTFQGSNPLQPKQTVDNLVCRCWSTYSDSQARSYLEKWKKRSHRYHSKFCVKINCKFDQRTLKWNDFVHFLHPISYGYRLKSHCVVSRLILQVV